MINMMILIFFLGTFTQMSFIVAANLQLSDNNAPARYSVDNFL